MCQFTFMAFLAFPSKKRRLFHFSYLPNFATPSPPRRAKSASDRQASELIRTVVLDLMTLNVSSWKITENASHCQLNHGVLRERKNTRGENECEAQAHKIKGIACHTPCADGSSLWHCTRTRTRIRRVRILTHGVNFTDVALVRPFAHISA